MSLHVALRHSFGAFTLDAAFEAPAGITVLFGRSGCGKSTIIDAIAGTLRPDAGRVEIAGRVLTDTAAGLHVPPHRRRIGVVFQDTRLFPHMTVRRNLDYGRRFAPRGAVGAPFDQIVGLLGLAPLLDRRPGALSGGERSRVALGRALLARPALVLADEPLAALDEARKAEILPYFERLRDAVAVPVVYVSHAPAEVARLATTVVAMEAGRVVRTGPPGEVLGDPQVTPLGAREAGAVLSARVAAHFDDGLSALAAGSGQLLVPRVALPVGAALRVRIAAHDVMLTLDPPVRMSALNAIPARVLDLRAGHGPGALVALDSDVGRLLARVTQRSARALALQPGTVCHAVVKAVAVGQDGIG